MKTNPINLSHPQAILTLNAGSSSIKFALFVIGEPFVRVVSGKFERIGLSNPTLTVLRADKPTQQSTVAAPDHASCLKLLLALLGRDAHDVTISAIGHRIVHGGPHYSQPERIDAQMLTALRQISPFDPEHMPAEIGLIEACTQHFRDVPQVACFDTAFHHDMPRVAKLLPLPRKYDVLGIQRYGFHGLSYAYLMEELARVAGQQAAFGACGAGASRQWGQHGRCPSRQEH